MALPDYINNSIDGVMAYHIYLNLIYAPLNKAREVWIFLDESIS